MTDPFAWLAGWIQQEWLVPALWRFGWMDWEDVSFMWALFAIYGVLQVVVNLAICWPAEHFWPLRRGLDRGHVGMDVIYTLIARIGIFPLVTFFGFYSLQVALNGWLTDHGYVPPTLEGLFPWLMGHPVVSFFVYAVILDFADYWRHRFSHMFGWWYGLHALHHAQRDMTFWSDDRNHVLDDVITYVWFIGVGLLIGVPPMQFPLLVLVLRLVESLSHANTTLHFGRIGERLLISPQFHRTHHGLRAAGHNSVNFGGVFPWWDMMFRTGNFTRKVVETGDPKAGSRLEGGSWLAQQIEGLRLAWRLALGRRSPRAVVHSRPQARS